MTMTNVDCKTESSELVQQLQAAGQSLETASGEIMLDFTNVIRVDAGSLAALQELAAKAANKGVQVALRGVSVDVYRVLKLMNITSGFCFLP